MVNTKLSTDRHVNAYMIPKVNVSHIPIGYNSILMSSTIFGHTISVGGGSCWQIGGIDYALH